MGIIAWGKWPINWLNKLGPHSKFAEIFITECELFLFFPTHHPLGTRQHGNIKPSEV
jgi:hypothetical protein